MRTFGSRRCAALLAVIFFVTPLRPIACSLGGLEHTVVFESRSAALSAGEERKFAEWFVWSRDVRPLSEIDISAIYFRKDLRSETLSKERVNAIKRLLDPLNTNNLPVTVDTGLGNREAYGPTHKVYDSVLIIVSPTCAETGTCCPIPIKK
ncbi:hypothetical protein [Diaphorobacter aerolatus]|uniref:hypothetical protein n=1 Tax=Diaphorobacter aerolatus TaxID=1288495 RepID=UPI001D019BD9|nr:hypothetical protein [Diaphorobacter aerolatus]